MDDGTRADVRAWLRKAEQDLLSVRIIRDARGPSTVACYLCQQAIEKLLKAVLVAHGDVPPKTHNLPELFRLIGARSGDLGLAPVDLGAWTLYAVAARYPGFGDPQADADLPEMLDAATRLAERVRALADS